MLVSQHLRLDLCSQAFFPSLHLQQLGWKRGRTRRLKAGVKPFLAITICSQTSTTDPRYCVIEMMLAAQCAWALWLDVSFTDCELL